jgi:prepilin-type N-terminal cleavage/methylation domain-containing protein
MASRQKGFTILELMIAVVIMSIVVVMALPTYSRFMAQKRLNAAARTLLADVRGARQLAIKEGFQYGILYNSATQYQVIKSVQPTFNQPASGTTVVVTRDFLSTNYGFYGVTMTVPVNMPVFQRNGTVSKWNSGTSAYSSGKPDDVTITNTNSETRSVAITTMGYSRIN